MIAGIFHEGSGLGNQLFRYVAVRVLAADTGYEWMMRDPLLFKGRDFMKLDLGASAYHVVLDHMFTNQWEEKKVVVDGVDIRGYDPEINFVEDNTYIDGEFQDERYFKHRLDEVREWLSVEPLELPDDLCVIGFRGGEYKQFPDLFLPQVWWDEAIMRMQKKNPSMKFKVVTDDVETAKQFFHDLPELEITHNVGEDWRHIRYAKHIIIANSSFYILPALLNENVEEVIAPRYWARHNTKTWALPQNYYKSFTYI